MNSLKYILTVLAIAHIGVVQAQITAIPDPIFEQYLIDFGYDTDGIINGQVLTSDIDFLNSLLINETAPIYPINDLTGIQDFAALESLQMNDVQAIVIDFGNLINLTLLDCSYNPKLASVNVSQCINLEILAVFSNYNLSTINLPQTESLETVILASNELTELDLSSYPNLNVINVFGNALTSLNIANGNNTNITNFNTSNNPDLQCVIVDDAAYSEANWTNIDPTTTFVETQQECDALSLNEARFLDFKLYPNPTRDYFKIHVITTMERIDIIDLVGKVVKSFTESLEEYSITGLSKGLYIISIHTDFGKSFQKLIIE